MAQLATLAVLLLSLLAVASCRVLETTSDDQGPPNAVVLTQDDRSDAAAAEVTLPALPTPAGENIVLSHGAPTPMLRLPSHRPTCRLHRHLWWTRHHGLARVHPAVDVVPAELARGEDQEPREAIAEPDPDSRPDTGAEQKPLHGEEEEEAAKAWKVEMLRRFRHGIRFHHRHHEQDVEEHDDHEQDKDEGTNMDLLARFHHRHHLRHHHEQDAEEEEDGHRQDKDEGLKMKLFRRFHHHHHHAHDSENEVDEVEELARKLGEAIMRRSLSHGGRRRRHHHHHHHHGAEGGVRNWFKGLLNRF